MLICLTGSKNKETSSTQKGEAFGIGIFGCILDHQQLRAGTGLEFFKMADKPTMKMRKKSKSFSYDRRRDSVKVKRQTKSLSFKSAAVETCKIQMKERQVGTIHLALFLII